MEVEKWLSDWVDLSAVRGPWVDVVLLPVLDLLSVSWSDLLCVALPWLQLVVFNVLLLILVFVSTRDVTRSVLVRHFLLSDIVRSVSLVSFLAGPAYHLAAAYSVTDHWPTQTMRHISTPIALVVLVEMINLFWLMLAVVSPSSNPARTNVLVFRVVFLSALLSAVIVPLFTASYPVSDGELAEFDRHGLHQQVVKNASTASEADFLDKVYWFNHYLMQPIVKLVFFSPIYLLFWKIFTSTRAARIRLYESRGKILRRSEPRQNGQLNGAPRHQHNGVNNNNNNNNNNNRGRQERADRKKKSNDYTTVALTTTGLAVLLQFFLLQFLYMGGFSSSEPRVHLWPSLGTLTVGSLTDPLRFYSFTNAPVLFFHALFSQLLYTFMADRLMDRVST